MIWWTRRRRKAGRTTVRQRASPQPLLKANCALRQNVVVTPSLLLDWDWDWAQYRQCCFFYFLYVISIDAGPRTHAQSHADMVSFRSTRTRKLRRE